MRLIDADLYVEMQLYDDEHEEWGEWNGTIEDLLNQWTERGCPPAIEVSEDCISRQALIDEILEDGNGAVLSYTKGMDEDDLVERIEEQMIQHFIGVIKYTPSVTPTERTGVWVQGDQDKLRGVQYCTSCGAKVDRYSANVWRYCPNCGAKMGEMDNE